jgi:cytochrome c-type biogenesis protein CcmE
MMEGERGGPPEAAAEANGIINNKTRLLVVGVVLVLALGYLIYAAFPGNTLYYVTVDEFLSDETNLDGRSLRVMGKLVPDSFQRGEGGTLAHFQLVDKEGDGNGSSLRASYVGVMPDLFFNPHSEIILEGSYGTDAVFETDSILVKCPSKYQSLEEELPDDYNNYSSDGAARSS